MNRTTLEVPLTPECLATLDDYAVHHGMSTEDYAAAILATWHDEVIDSEVADVVLETPKTFGEAAWRVFATIAVTVSVTWGYLLTNHHELFFDPEAAVERRNPSW